MIDVEVVERAGQGAAGIAGVHVGFDGSPSAAGSRCARTTDGVARVDASVGRILNDDARL
jgi:hypothetical protein